MSKKARKEMNTVMMDNRPERASNNSKKNVKRDTQIETKQIAGFIELEREATKLIKAIKLAHRTERIVEEEIAAINRCGHDIERLGLKRRTLLRKRPVKNKEVAAIEDEIGVQEQLSAVIQRQAGKYAAGTNKLMRKIAKISAKIANDAKSLRESWS